MGGVVLSGRRVNAGIDLSYLKGSHEVEGIGLNIDGHTRNPVCILPAAGKTDEAFVGAVRRFLLKQL